MPNYQYETLIVEQTGKVLTINPQPPRKPERGQ